MIKNSETIHLKNELKKSPIQYKILTAPRLFCDDKAF